MDSCKHPFVFPTGDCISCGVLATLFPGRVEDHHKMVHLDKHSSIPTFYFESSAVKGTFTLPELAGCGYHVADELAVGSTAYVAPGVTPGCKITRLI